jgi:hypothetical protein
MTEGNVLIRLGGEVVALRSADSAWLGLEAERFSGFVEEGAPAWTFRYTVVERPSPPCGPGGFVREDDGFWLRDGALEARVRLDEREVELRGPRSVTAFDRALRYLLPSIVGDGLVLHGTGIEDQPGAWACAGPSGSGKSTLAGLAGPRAVCDELVSVRRAGGEWRLDSLPFWTARPAVRPLTGVCLLRHGPRQERTRLGETAAFRAVGANVLWPTYAPAEMERRFPLLADLVERVPVFDLAFAPGPDVLPELTRAVA